NKVAGMLPDQLLSMRSIYCCWSVSFNKKTSLFIFCLFTNGVTELFKSEISSTLTSNTFNCSDLYSSFSFSKAGNSFMQGAHQVAQKLIMYVVSLPFSILAFSWSILIRRTC